MRILLNVHMLTRLVRLIRTKTKELLIGNHLGGLRFGKGFFSQTKETSLKALGQGPFAVLRNQNYTEILLSNLYLS